MARTLDLGWVRSLGQLGRGADAVTMEASECRSRNLIPDAASSRARQVAAWMRLRSGDPMARDTDSDAESDTNQVGVSGF
jgi:hypothetical protein